MRKAFPSIILYSSHYIVSEFFSFYLLKGILPALFTEDKQSYLGTTEAQDIGKLTKTYYIQSQKVEGKCY